MVRFTKSFTQQEPIGEEAIARAVEVMRTGRLHRYNVDDGEASETALFEAAFARYQGSRYALACASGGYALHITLRAAGLERGEPVLTNAFTLAPVPGAIDHAGGRPLLVEITDDYVIDLEDLERKASTSGARFLLLSHMRGHIADMDALTALCAAEGLILIEDCAHTMGAKWRGQPVGSFGKAACFSVQTYKHLNAGEGGLVTSDDADLMARAIVHSGSYMLYGRHLAAPDEAAFRKVRLETPNYSGRMDNLRAAILHAQLRELDDRCARWNALHAALAEGLAAVPGLRLPEVLAEAEPVMSSLQFALPDLDIAATRRFIAACTERGVEVKWFGDDEPRGFTSRFDSWRYIKAPGDLPATRRILAHTLDLRLPLTFDTDDCKVIAGAIAEAVEEATAPARATT